MEVVVQKVRGTWSRWTPEVTVVVSASLFGWERHVILVVLLYEESLCSALESVSK